MNPWTIQNVQRRYSRAHGYVVQVRNHGLSSNAVLSFHKAYPDVALGFQSRPSAILFKSLDDLMLFKLVCAGTQA